MGKTKIEWAQHTWNPITGCSHAGSPGCDNCYARKMARRLAGRCGYPAAPNHFDVTLHPERLREPLLRKKPTTYFVCSMSDLFHEDVEFDFIHEVYHVMAVARRHTFMILTKRPERMREWYEWEYQQDPDEFCLLKNVWLGVTVEDQERADERIPELLACPISVGAVFFVSVEPMLSIVDFTQLNVGRWTRYNRHGETLGMVICGGETGPGARVMRPEWARSLRDQCQVAGIPFFFKNMGNKAPIPDDLMIREFPKEGQ